MNVSFFTKSALALAMMVSTTVSFAPVTHAQEVDYGSVEMLSTEMLSTDLLEGQEFESLDAELYASRWGGGYDRPYRPRPPRARGVQCRAVNARGMAFYGRGPNMPMARDAALDRCYQVSRRCYMDGCQPL